MRLGVLGVNDKSAKMALRERVAAAVAKRLTFEAGIASRFSCVVLSTCNRTEIYFSSEDLAETHSQLLALLREEIPEVFEHALYSYFGSDCFLHLAQVTAGLDSVILGETEIQRQVKQAYEHTALHYRLTREMHYLFQKCLKIGKEMRTSFSLSTPSISIAHMVWSVAEHFFSQHKPIETLFVGNSETSRSIISHFRSKGMTSLSLCTRSPLTADEVQNIPLYDFSHLPKWHAYDLVICATNASSYVITPSQAPESVRGKLLVDLSVPRSVDPQLIRHPGITLLNMEDVNRMMAAQQRKNFAEIGSAQFAVVERVQRSLLTFEQKQKRVYQCV